MRRLPVLNLTPLNFPSQNHRYIVDLDTANCFATSLGLTNFSVNIAPSPLSIFLPLSLIQNVFQFPLKPPHFFQKKPTYILFIVISDSC